MERHQQQSIYMMVSETVHLYNPSNGWLQNCNSTPYSVAGPESPKEKIICLTSYD
jgi:acyl-homoserine lactone acylase PvdQ